MNYNIHPIFVHFPIAMLVVYSIIKILPLQKWFPNVAWRDIERALLLIGVLGAFAALATGDTAEHLTHPNRQLVNLHSTFAGISTGLYGALLLGEIAAIANARYLRSSNMLRSFSVQIERLLCHRVFSAVIAFVALLSITLTGLLGGAIVYKTTADPLAGIVLKMFGITL